jgi:hypothetical protein
VADDTDNCPATSNPAQEDTDGDGTGNACDTTPFGTPPTLDLPDDITQNATSSSGATVTYTAPTATDVEDGPITPKCTSAPTSELESGDTFPIGTTTVTCTATDSHNNTATASFKVNVVYDFGGDNDDFFKPVSNQTLNTVRPGQTVPVKFSLGTIDFGTDIFAPLSETLPSNPYSKPVNCLTGDDLNTDPVEQTSTAASGLIENGAGQYTYNWKTNSGWPVGSCREFVMTFKDGTTQKLLFQFSNK